MEWHDHTNATLLDIDQWFGTYGNLIPESPRVELENHLRRLSEQIHGYHSFLASSATYIPPERPWQFGTGYDGRPFPPVFDAVPADPVDSAKVRSLQEAIYTIVVIFACLIGAIGFLAWWTSAKADDEHIQRYHSDPIYSQWLNKLERPDGGGSCCNLNDCEQTSAEWRDGQWFAIVRGHWRPIPADKIVNDSPAPDGEAYVCAAIVSAATAPIAPIYCFVPPMPPT